MKIKCFINVVKTHNNTKQIKMFSVPICNVLKIKQITRLSSDANLMPQRQQRSLTMSPIFNVETHEDFENKVKKCDKPVIVDFFATWCSPCKKLTPRLENIVTEKKGEIILAKVDIDEHSDLALDYNVGTVPALVVMHNGKILNRMEGLQDTDVIRNWINEAVSKKQKLEETKKKFHDN